MDELRHSLAPLTDWIPASLRDRLPVEAWWLIYLAAGLLVLILLYAGARGLLRSLLNRRKRGPAWERNLREDLEELPLPTAPEGSLSLSVYHLPARLRLVVVASAGKEVDIDATVVEKLLERLVPGLGKVVERDRPRIRVWPAQLSHHGFGVIFHRNTPRPEGEEEPSRWVLIAGRTLLGKQSMLLGLGLWTDEPSTVGRLNLEPHQWLDVLRLRSTGR
jgi:hypothetical protein